jgi:hypothetical protein
VAEQTFRDGLTAPAEVLGPAMKRAADVIMARDRLGAAVATPLSFTRTTIRMLSRGGWKLDRLRIDLDADGNGEVLYRFHTIEDEFHFLVISKALSEDVKLDRNFAADWDVKAALCLGPWSAERDAHIRLQTRRMRSARAEYDALVFLRANRSGRLFDHVVESLAAGRQPNAAMIAAVGYIIRTTGFTGNGQLGTRPFAGLAEHNPAKSPYAAHIIAAFLLREYVFDLVDYMAANRSPDAVALAPAYRRYLGIGNSAATGLTAFFVNHPCFIHDWCSRREDAYREAKTRPLAAADVVNPGFLTLVDKAIQYFEEDGSGGQGVFDDTHTIAADLRALRDLLRSQSERKAALSRDAVISGAALCTWAEQNCAPTTVEIIDSMLLELYPDLIERFSEGRPLDEELDIFPSQTAGELKQLIKGKYDWALAIDPMLPGSNRFFWFRPVVAPLDVRRGHTDIRPDIEYETNFDIGVQVRRLYDTLRAMPPETPICQVLFTRPDLRAAVARVQSLSGREYAELRDNPRSEDFSPFGPIRFVLSFYGLDKFEVALPKSVRGALLQGAPTADDLARGLEGDWPFPLAPGPESAGAKLNRVDLPFASGSMDEGTSPRMLVAPVEIRTRVEAAARARCGLLGPASLAAWLIEDAEMLFYEGAEQFAAHIEANHLYRDYAGLGIHVGNGVTVVDANGISALLAAPCALDFAIASATSSAAWGAAIILGATGMPLLDTLPLRAARQGLTALAIRHGGVDGRNGRLVVADPGATGPAVSAQSWTRPSPPLKIATVSSSPQRLVEQTIAYVSDLQASDKVCGPLQNAPQLDQPYFMLVCARPGRLAARCLAPLSSRDGEAILSLDASQWATRRLEVNTIGIMLRRSVFKSLTECAAGILLSNAEEEPLRMRGFDHQKSF